MNTQPGQPITVALIDAPEGLEGLAIALVDATSEDVLSEPETEIMEAAPGRYAATFETPDLPDGTVFLVVWIYEDEIRATDDDAYTIAGSPFVDDTGRPTLATIRAALRRMIGDTNTEEPEFADEDLDRLLDVHATELDRYPLWPADDDYLVWLLDLVPLEGGYTLRNGSGQEIAPVIADEQAGRVQFGLFQAVVTVDGRAHDIHAAAADALDEWAARLARNFDVSTHGQNLSRSQQAKALREAASGYRARARYTPLGAIRGDGGR